MSHGYFACPAAQEVWCACSPILILLGIAPPLAFSPATLLPASGVPAAFRPRFALWRSCVLRVLYVCRHDAGIRGREAGAPPVFAFTASTDPLSSAASILAELLTAAWLRVLRLPDTTRPAAVAAFGKRWASGGSFVQLTDTRIDFTAVSDELMFPPSIH
ncbi:unnamed protein product [Tilletia controversa]|uniref:Uncharacterized protein n=2 Tax=Tilletia TaxID=13289 RepID=A0A8X7STH2_9BASI|nr:hypothetical protein A4X06_0g7679 [Tilletia controversa]KAE8247984.1 hypothetical protein A4X03_0g6905 [Tilletia caries]CAD6940230.1 unnamed protein product [Tilletia caries]CAD6971471.1 unnamed protein product [Tilletia controversa]